MSDNTTLGPPGKLGVSLEASAVSWLARFFKPRRLKKLAPLQPNSNLLTLPQDPKEQKKFLRALQLKADLRSNPKLDPATVESYIELDAALQEDPKNISLKVGAWLWHGFNPEDWDALPKISEVSLPAEWADDTTPTMLLPPPALKLKPETEALRAKVGDRQRVRREENVKKYDFPPHGGERKPLAPRSALYRPARVSLTAAEEIAQELPKFLTGVTLKPEFKKKLKAKKASGDIRRVYFDAKGKMKDVPVKK